MIRPVRDYSSQVIALIKDLLILNGAERARGGPSPSTEQLEHRKCKRTKIRQELVQALSLHKRQRETLVMQNHIKQ
jgi:hypothetical protein